MTTLSPTPPPPRDHLRWLFVRTLALVIATLAVMIALFYALENFRGAREWARQRDAILAQGGSVDPSTFIPAPVPDGSNFARIPLLASLFEYERGLDGGHAWKDTNAFRRAVGVFRYSADWPRTAPSPQPSWQRGETTPLADWSRTFREVTGKTAGQKESSADSGIPRLELPGTTGDEAADVLAALKSYEAQSTEISQGIRSRPLARFDIRYDDDYEALLPHLAILKKSVGHFALRACARLAKGQTDEAYEDTRTALLLTEIPRTEPFLISQLVRLADLDLALQPVWEGARRHAWSEHQLQQLQALLISADPLPAWRRAHHLEAALAARVTRRMANSTTERARFATLLRGLTEGSGASTPWLEPYIQYAPRGWLYASLAETSRRFLTLSTTLPPDLDALRAASEAPPQGPPPLRLALHEAFCSMSKSLGNPADQWARAFRGQAHARLAVSALALERMYLRTGRYPEDLKDLVPQFLPAVPEDPMSGTPLRYERTSPEAFRLWSVGANRRDDGGSLAEEGRDRLFEGDWTWRTP